MCPIYDLDSLNWTVDVGASNGQLDKNLCRIAAFPNFVATDSKGRQKNVKAHPVPGDDPIEFNWGH